MSAAQAGIPVTLLTKGEIASVEQTRALRAQADADAHQQDALEAHAHGGKMLRMKAQLRVSVAVLGLWQRDPQDVRPTTALAKVLIAVIRCYQVLLSPMLGQSCRFEPSCSQYGLEAIRMHGAVMGIAWTLRRLVRCHPWHPGGIDPVPSAGTRFFSWSRH